MLWKQRSGALKKIQVINKNIVKILASKKTNERIEKKDVYKKTNILSVENLYKFAIIIDNYYKQEHRTRTPNLHNLRRVILRSPMTYNRYGDRQLKIVVPKLFNDIPDDLLLLNKIGIVKKEIKNWLMNTIQYKVWILTVLHT